MPASNNTKSVKTNKVPTPTNGVPVKKVHMPRTVSITQGLSKGRNVIQETKIEYTAKEKDKEVVTGNDSFSVRAAVLAINEFVGEHGIGASKKTAFTTYEPEITDISKITFIVENTIEEDAIKEYKVGLTKKLRKKLNNKNIEILTRMVKANEEKVLLVTDKQKYDYLVDKYPALDKLKKTFNLDLQ